MTDILKDITEFRASDDIISELKKVGTVRKFNEGDVLFHENSFTRSIPIIIKGSIRVYQTDDDYREILLYYLKKGDTCIMSFMAGLYKVTNKLRGVAHEDSEVLMVPIEKAGKLMKNHPQWVEYIFRVYHQRFEELLDVVNAVAFKKMDERLLQFIIKRADMSGDNSIQVTHEEIANELGTARVVVSRLLKQMEHEGLVKLGRNRIILL